MRRPAADVAGLLRWRGGCRLFSSWEYFSRRWIILLRGRRGPTLGRLYLPRRGLPKGGSSVFKKLFALLIVAGLLGLTTGCSGDKDKDKKEKDKAKTAKGDKKDKKNGDKKEEAKLTITPP